MTVQMVMTMIRMVLRMEAEFRITLVPNMVNSTVTAMTRTTPMMNGMLSQLWSRAPAPANTALTPMTMMAMNRIS